MPQTGANRNLEHQETDSASRCSVLAQRRAALEDARSDEERFSIIDGLQDVAHLIAEVMAEGEDALHAPSAYANARFLDAALRQRKTMLAEQRGFWADPEPVCVVPYRASDKPEVTIVVPVYNDERFVSEAVASACRQSFDSIEVLCVDDGSADGSLETLCKLAETDKRIAIYRQENSGLSVARNTGISRAAGAYLCFLDSDDRLAGDALDVLVGVAKADDLDAVMFNAEAFFETEADRISHEHFVTYYQRNGTYEGISSGPCLIGRLVANNDYKPAAWLSLVKRQYLVSHELYFHPGIIHEDNPYTFALLAFADRVALINKPLYQRRVRGGSLMTSSKRFGNAYGYYASCVDMSRVLCELVAEGRISEFERLRMRMLVFVVLHNARQDYFALSASEQGALLAMPEAGAAAFRKAMDAFLDTPGSARRIQELEQQVARYQKMLKPLRKLWSLVPNALRRMVH